MPVVIGGNETRALSLMFGARVNSGTSRSGSFENWILKGDALRVVFLKPFFRSVRGGEDLEVPSCL